MSARSPRRRRPAASTSSASTGRDRGRCAFRTRSLAGRWSAWQSPGRHESDTGRARRDGLAVPGARAREPAACLLHLEPGRAPVAAPPRGGGLAADRLARRRGADNELLRRNQPRYASAVRLVIVHHTATPNDYTPDQAAAIVRGIDVYHVQGERLERHRLQLPRRPLRPGLRGPVRRHHAQRDRRARARVQHGQRRHRADRQLHDGEADARGRAVARAADRVAARPRTRRSGLDAHVRRRTASERWRAGTKVQLRAVSGHRDTGLTSCPGNQLYPQLDRIAAAAEQIGLPKLYAPVVRGKLGGPVVVLGAALVGAAVDDHGARARRRGRSLAARTGSARRSRGRGTRAGRAAAATRGRWRPARTCCRASGVIGRQSLPPPPPPALVQGLAVDAGASSRRTATGTPTRGRSRTRSPRASAVTATVTDATGAPVETLFSAQEQSARAISFACLAGRASRRSLHARARRRRPTTGASATATAAFTVDRTLSGSSLRHRGDLAERRRRRRHADGVVRARGAAQVTVTILAPDGSTAATLFAGQLDPGTYAYGWDGRLADGSAAPPATTRCRSPSWTRSGRSRRRPDSTSLVADLPGTRPRPRHTDSSPPGPSAPLPPLLSVAPKSRACVTAPCRYRRARSACRRS